MGPAVYYVANPIAAILVVYLLCACVVYCLVPAARKRDIHFNPKKRKEKATREAIQKLEIALLPLLPSYGLTWEDIEDRRFFRVSVSFCQPVIILAVSRLDGLLSEESGMLGETSLASLQDGGEDPEEFINGAMDAT